MLIQGLNIVKLDGMGFVRKKLQNDSATVEQSGGRPLIHRTGQSSGENGYSKSFKGKFRDELLNGEMFYA